MYYYDIYDIFGPAAPRESVGFDAVELAPGQGNLEQDYYVTDKGGVNTSYGDVFRSPAISSPNLMDFLKSLSRGVGKFATSKAGMAGIMALLSALDRPRASGGGTTMTYQGPRQYTRTIVPGATGTPIARYAANGGLMQAYASGGAVQMEDGGFVMTKRAVDGAGGPQGIRQLVPDARPILGPGTGTSDSIPATIKGPNGVTPAKVSNGEVYIPPGYNTNKLYALMHSLERKA